MATLLVTFETEPEHRQAIDAALPDGVEARYLQDLPEADQPAAVADADGLMVWVMELELGDGGLDRLRDGQVLQTVSAGVDHVPFERFPAGLTVLSNAGAFAEPVAEHVLALYLALAKRLHVEDRKLRAGTFDQFAINRWVAGSTCAVVGFGAIGRASADLLQRVGVEILAVNRSGEADADVAFLGTPDDLEPVLRRADAAVLASPLTEETRDLVDAEALSWLGGDGMLVNVARGELVDQGALYEHLEAHPGFQAGLESWWTEPLRDGAFELDYPLLELPNVLGCPHNSAQLPGIRERALARAAGNLGRALAGDEADNVVDPARGY